MLTSFALDSRRKERNDYAWQHHGEKNGSEDDVAGNNEPGGDRRAHPYTAVQNDHLARVIAWHHVMWRGWMVSRPPQFFFTDRACQQNATRALPLATASRRPPRKTPATRR